MADQLPPELMAAMGGAMPQAPAAPVTRDPKVIRLELRLVSELVARRRREDLMPPESLMDTPNRVEFPILRAPRENFAPMPPAPMNFLDQMPMDVTTGMDSVVSDPAALLDGAPPPDAMLDEAPAPVEGMPPNPAPVAADPTLPPDGVDAGGF